MSFDFNFYFHFLLQVSDFLNNSFKVKNKTFLVKTIVNRQTNRQTNNKNFYGENKQS
jgi:hypothetical protein